MGFLNGSSHHGLMKDVFRNIQLAFTSPGIFPVLDEILSGPFPQTFSVFLSFSLITYTESFNALVFTESSVLCPAWSQDPGFPAVPVQVLQDCTASN